MSPFGALVAFVLLHLGLPGGVSQTPISLMVRRDWRLPADHPVGGVVERAQVIGGDRDSIVVFDLTPGSFKNGVHLFRIDPKSGVIYLNNSLHDKAGEQYSLYVVASEGKVTAKTEIRVVVDQPYGNGGGGPIRGPFFPGAHPHFPPHRPPSTPTTTTDDDQEEDSDEDPTRTSSAAVPTPPLDSPVVNNPPSGHSSTLSSTQSSASSSTQSSASSSTPSSSSANLGIATGEGQKVGAGDLTLTIVPIIVVVGTAPLLALAAWLLRRKIISRRKKKKGEGSVRFHLKEEVKGESNSLDTLDGSGPSNEASAPPTALLNWQRALSNRYESADPTGPPLDADRKWEFPRHHLRIMGILGEGCFGQVWKCEALNINNEEGTQLVAVKTLKENAGEREKKDLLSELSVMKMFKPHPNVVTLLGCCTERDPLFVIMEYVPHGKLQSYLRASRAEHYYGNLHGRSSHLTSQDLTSFTFQVARGMEYLSSKGIIHRDLAARNILVGEGKTCKVADFGFARDVVGQDVYERKTEGRLPIRWMAPESLYDNIFTTKTDVWGFGVLMWEIVTLGSTPYPGMAAGEVMRRVRDGYRLEKPEHCRREIYNIMYYCWDRDPRERPTFSELVQLLEQLLLSDTDYIELDRFPDHAYYNILSNLSGEKL